MNNDYGMLSRRGLIELNKNFDQENDEKLLKYLQKHFDEYEQERFIEKVTDSVDKALGRVCKSKNNIKRTLVEESGRLIDTTLGLINETANKASCSLLNLAANMIDKC